MALKIIQFWKDSVLPFVSLFTSLGTLVCCALPALLVSLGLGASLAGVVSTLPILVTFSENKLLVFGISGMALLLSVWVQYKNRNAPCPIDPKKAKACMAARRFNKYILAAACLIYGVGFFFAFLARYVFL